MPGKLFTSAELDVNGRQLVLSDSITHVRYYDNSLETWDKIGAGSQSWHSEVYTPNDTFDEESVNTSRWSLNGPATRTLGHEGGSLSLGIEKDEGSVYLSSDGKWRLSGDFDVRLYIDWSSYYNEYRSLTHSYLKVGYDDSNAARISFSFNGVDGYQFSSEKTVSRNIRYFDWKENGSPAVLGGFNDATAYTFLRVVRAGGEIKTYISNGVTNTQVGDTISDSVFAGDVYVEIGIQSKEFNTYRHRFTKFYVVSGNTTPSLEFFSSSRGRRQDFPPRIIAVVDGQSLSLIDEDTSTLWMRFSIGDLNLIPDSNVKVSACNGILYCATSGGVVAFDFVKDKIFRYRGSEIQVADESISLRNAGVTFRVFASATGAMPSNNTHDVSCRVVGSSDYLAITHDSGVTVRRALASGVSNCADGPVPGSIVSISEKGALYWSGYDPDANQGQVSYYSNVAALATGGTTNFSRTGFYGTSTGLPILGEVITSFDVRTVEGFDQLAVGSTEGVSFISQNLGGSTTYGVESPAVNPFTDPTFEKHIGISWIPFYDGFIHSANILRTTSWKTAGAYSLALSFSNPPQGGYFVAGTQCGVYQLVDLTGVERLYFDINLVGGAGSYWEFQVTVDGEVIKSYANAEGNFTKLTDSAVTLGYEGIHRVEFKLYLPAEVSSSVGMGGKYVQIDNIQTSVGNPVYKILPPGNAAVKEVLLQYDSQGHKIYFSTAGGFGAIDLNDRSLDYFTPLSDLVVDPTTESISADFARVDNET